MVVLGGVVVSYERGTPVLASRGIHFFGLHVSVFDMWQDASPKCFSPIHKYEVSWELFSVSKELHDAEKTPFKGFTLPKPSFRFLDLGLLL